MTTTTKIDEVRDGQHFVQLELRQPVLKSVLSAKKPVKHSFFIDGASVDEPMFWALYEHANSRLNQLFNQCIALMETFQATGVADLEALERIEAQLTPDEQKIQGSNLAKFDFSEVEPPEIGEFLQRASALGFTLPHCVQQRRVSLEKIN